MTKKIFLEKVRSGISSLPENDIKRWLDYYSEMIDDRIEDGMTEEDAVSAMGSVEDVVSQILRDENAEEKNTEKESLWAAIRRYLNRYINNKNRFWIILVLILAVPIWAPVVGGLFGAIVSVVAAVFSVSVGLYAGCFALIAAFVGCLVKGIAILSLGGLLGNAMLYFGVGCILIGFAIFMFLLAHMSVKLIIKAIKFVYSFVKSKLQRKEERI